MSDDWGVVLLICFLTLFNLLTVWMNVKLLTENTKHRLLEK